ncbi:portal protein [Aurantimonas coralicida]|uniref:portal protein n=1 Tax=Aurantimonas coralicida TaxID=182270 RepID=UPI0023891ADE|nr:portal protein [Aurantimonas coralicida]MDE0921506.1 portal protein [Aurantimonas coralicida]
MEDRHVVRRRQIWSRRSPWDALYRDAYEYAIPHRRPGGEGQTKNPIDRIFDMTATMSSMHFAGSLQQDLFPSGQAPFTLQSGALARLKLGAGAVKLDRELEKVGSAMHPFFQTGDWDTSLHETCIDLGVGTGALLPIKGDAQNPVLFVSIPFDEIAIGIDMSGRTNFVSWKQQLERQQIIDAFPDGKFPDGFKDASKAGQPETIYQDWVKLTGGNQFGWTFAAFIAEGVEPIATSWSRTQPIAIPRYYRVPGEPYGRGPVLLALPSIKTLNKAQELALKAAAIQMLGIWGYRSGGTFNPDTVRVGPGEFWPMQSTGGILGPDVSRIDPASGRLDVASMIIGNLRDDIKMALFDNRIADKSGTPRSASEIVGQLRQKAETHIGAFGRLSNEIMPVIVPRVAEILYEAGFLSMPLNVDQFLIATSVQSPMQAAMNAGRLASIANYIEMVGAIAGPESIGLYAHINLVLEKIGDGLQIDKTLIPTDEERAEIEAKRQEQQLQLMAAGAMQQAAPKMLEQAVAQ